MGPQTCAARLKAPAGRGLSSSAGSRPRVPRESLRCLRRGGGCTCVRGCFLTRGVFSREKGDTVPRSSRGPEKAARRRVCRQAAPAEVAAEIPNAKGPGGVGPRPQKSAAKDGLRGKSARRKPKSPALPRRHGGRPRGGRESDLCRRFFRANGLPVPCKDSLGIWVGEGPPPRSPTPLRAVFWRRLPLTLRETQARALEAPGRGFRGSGAVWVPPVAPGGDRRKLGSRRALFGSGLAPLRPYRRRYSWQRRKPTRAAASGVWVAGSMSRVASPWRRNKRKTA